MKFGIIGNGFVGGATQVLECAENEMVVQDIVPEKCVPPGLTLNDLKECDFLFIAVPTPMMEGGECDLSIVNSVMNDLRSVELDFNRTHVIIRSTVLPGTTDTYGVQFMPEFLTEKNYIQDFINCTHWVLGAGKDELNSEFVRQYEELINNAHRAGKIKHNTVIPMLNREAELVKQTRNSYLALKVSQFNEIYQVAKALNINYDQFIRGVVCDERIGASHTAVPGHDGHFGQGGTCFPKDTNALKQFQIRTVGVEPPILSGAIFRNETIDRPEQDWKSDRRAFTGTKLTH